MKNDDLIHLSQSGPGWSTSPARYAKGKMVVRIVNESMFKNEGVWLAEALGGKWSRRDGGHQLSRTRAAAWIKLYSAGWTATRKILSSDKKPYLFGPFKQPRIFVLKDALKHIEATASHSTS